MFDLPNFSMYAVVHNSIVIDCGFENNEKIISPLTQNTYIKNDNFEYIKMTIENSPVEIGMKYINNQFIKE